MGARRACTHPSPIFTLLEMVYNKLHPSLFFHLQDENTRKVVILFLQEVVVSSSKILNSRFQEDENNYNCTYNTYILLSVFNKICSLLEYHGVHIFMDALSFLRRTTH
jgi:hypothetical protein